MPRIFGPALSLLSLTLVACSRSAPPDPQPLREAKAEAAALPAPPAQAPDASTAEAELVKLEEAYSNALIKKDRAFLMAYYAPDWKGGNWLGFWTKSTMLKAVMDERYVVRSMRLSHVDARVFGNVGIVQGISDEVTAVDGRETSGKWSFTDVFVFRDGLWSATASHTSEVKPRP